MDVFLGGLRSGRSGLGGSVHEVAYAARLERPRGLEILQLEIDVTVGLSACAPPIGIIGYLDEMTNQPAACDNGAE